MGHSSPRTQPLASLLLAIVVAGGLAGGGTPVLAAQAAFDAQAMQAELERSGLSPADQLQRMRGQADAFYAKGDYANAARALQWEVQGAERAGKPPAEDRLLLLKDCYAHLNDGNALAWSLEKLVTWYPKKTYWGELLDRTQDRPDFGQPLALDVNRLRFLTGTLHGPAGYVNLASQAQQAGYPAEALRVLDRGFADGVLGTGPDAAHQRELRAQIAGQAAQQASLLAQPAAERDALASKDGEDLVRLGFAYVTQGQPEKGLALMEQGLRKPLLDKRPQYARLRLGIAALQAGQRAKALSAFANVGGRHGAADLARLWGLYTRNLG